MTIKALVKPGEYHDSVSLMLAARELARLDGIRDAAVLMATQANKSILAGAGLLTDEANSALPGDLVIAVASETDAQADSALEKVEGLLKKKTASSDGDAFRSKTIRGALASHPAANVAVISVAGRYAADEAWDALTRGLHVLLFSDNVSLEEEIALKRYARDHGLLLMGPGAGTAILNGVALGFADALPSGPVGIVSAAGTGLQEVTTLLARRGIGISQGIGTGGRDLKKEVGGIMMLEALKALQSDAATSVIALISKPPADEVVPLILAQVSRCDKPTVVCFLGGKLDSVAGAPNAIPTRTLYECALMAAKAVAGDSLDLTAFLASENATLAAQADELRKRLGPGQCYLRGLFSGGTLCYEAQVIWKDMLDTAVFSNAPLPGGPLLPDSTTSLQHTAVDLGEEEFTVGRPHPMIDNDVRIRRLMQDARDPQVAVILLDVVLGYGAHPNPASELTPAIEEARRLRGRENGDLLVVASVTGTEDDPQCLSRTVSDLEHAGVVVCSSNSAAARLSALLVSGNKGG